MSYPYRLMIRQFDTDVDDFSKALESVFQGKATVLYRMRLSCAFSDKDGNNIGNKGEGILTYTSYPNAMTRLSSRLASNERGCFAPRLKPASKHN
jgi:hypothetical protein